MSVTLLIENKFLTKGKEVVEVEGHSDINTFEQFLMGKSFNDAIDRDMADPGMKTWYQRYGESVLADFTYMEHTLLEISDSWKQPKEKQ